MKNTSKNISEKNMFTMMGNFYDYLNLPKDFLNTETMKLVQNFWEAFSADPDAVSDLVLANEDTYMASFNDLLTVKDTALAELKTDTQEIQFGIFYNAMAFLAAYTHYDFESLYYELACYHSDYRYDNEYKYVSERAAFFLHHLVELQKVS